MEPRVHWDSFGLIQPSGLGLRGLALMQYSLLRKFFIKANETAVRVDANALLKLTVNNSTH